MFFPALPVSSLVFWSVETPVIALALCVSQKPILSSWVLSLGGNVPRDTWAPLHVGAKRRDGTPVDASASPRASAIIPGGGYFVPKSRPITAGLTPRVSEIELGVFKAIPAPSGSAKRACALFSAVIHFSPASLCSFLNISLE